MTTDQDLDTFANDGPAATFLKWDDGPHVLRFNLPDNLAETKRQVHWVNGRPVNCPGRDSCEICPTIKDSDDPRKLKTSWVLQVVLADGEEMVLELSKKAKDGLVPELQRFQAKHGDAWRNEFSGQWYEARRKGTGRNIEYTYKPVKAPKKGKDQDEIQF